MAASIGYLVLVPLAVYLGSYTLFFSTGHSWAAFLELHRRMLQYHLHLKDTHIYASAWWQWPLILRSVWYYTGADAAGGKVANIYALGNPFLWWPGFLAVLWLLVRVFTQKENSFAGRFAAVGFFSTWIALAAPSRVMFLYHYAIPSIFMMIGLVCVLKAIEEKFESRGFLVPYLVFVLAGFIYFYPIAAGIFLTKPETAARFWLPSWQ